MHRQGPNHVLSASPPAGIAISKKAGMIPLQMELGGKVGL